ncbi:protein IQ-DOMAIN 19-like [Cornus florida]|uniref:protein IQ-DOMAIN 19-like n=1 Tax=Cornus florida TaxID=4283 RepID=UPI00289F60E6|nr:protein IQ-DOMAIN 19-like [Cornus florida]
MGKASKWIRNFLIGKKDEKEKKKESCFSLESFATPKEKPRWSFVRSSSTDTNPYKSTRSFDSIVTCQLVTQNAQNRVTAIAVAANEATERGVGAKHAVSEKPGPVEDAAATKIQAVFRSYLARKALCALRGLVKLQALARGHLVRKQTTAMMRCMHSLMAIQVRARVQRIQMADEAQGNRRTTRTTNRELAQGSQLSRTYSETMDAKVNETRQSLKSKSEHMNYSKIERTRLPISKHDHQLQISPNPSTLADKSSRICNKQFQDNSSTKSQRSPQYFSTMFDSNQTRAPFSTPVPDDHDYQFSPNFMANTESSKAKARSRSEPKQRPKWRMKQKSTRTASTEKMDVTQEILMHSSLSHSKTTAKKNQYPWLMKLYRQTKSIKDSECDSTSTMTNNSNYCNSLIVCEPPVNLY